MISFVTGGARSGKTSLALSLVGEGAEVAYLATATRSDDEMSQRIEAHRSSRPSDWETVEEPVDLAGALSSIPSAHAVVVDCLTLWIANRMENDKDEVILHHSRRAIDVARAHEGNVVVVSNEVGSGLVPMDPVGRRFRDLQGWVNQDWASSADRAYLSVAGMALPLQDGSRIEP